MSGIECAELYDVARGTVQSLYVDFGARTAGVETGVLKAGDTVSSCAVAVYGKPSGADDPTFGSVTVINSTGYVNSRLCAANEAVTVRMTLGASQTYGSYRLVFTATTTNGEVLPRYVRFSVVEPS